MLPLDWLFPALDTMLCESEKNDHFSTLDPKYVRLLRHIPQKATKVKLQFVQTSMQREPKNQEFMDFSKRARWN